MPLYAYRCPQCQEFEVQAAMGQVQASVSCPSCGQDAARRFTSPHLSRSTSSAYRLIESTQRSASEPAVVRSPAGQRPPGSAAAVTMNPLHKKLPRPD